MRISDEQWATLDGEACRRCRASQEITERAIRVAENHARQCDRVCKSFDRLAESHTRPPGPGDAAKRGSPGACGRGAWIRAA